MLHGVVILLLLFERLKVLVEGIGSPDKKNKTKKTSLLVLQPISTLVDLACILKVPGLR